MGFPNRAVIEAPAGRDLLAETGRAVARIPGATNGVVALWDTLDQDYFTALADAALVIYPDLPSIPLSRRKYCVQFATYPTVAAIGTGTMKRWIDCTVLDFIKITNGGIPSVKTATTLIAGDHPTESDLMHRWFGNIAETLGAPA